MPKKLYLNDGRYDLIYVGNVFKLGIVPAGTSLNYALIIKVDYKTELRLFRSYGCENIFPYIFVAFIFYWYKFR